LEQPLVIDFELRTDGFWIIAQNISTEPLMSFSAEFSKPILGLPLPNPPGGRRVVSGYDLFINCQYLAPGKRFEFFVENDRVFFEINPAEFKISITTVNTSGQRSSYTIGHNLNIYRQLIQTAIVNS
jgi:hypothetical protein